MVCLKHPDRDAVAVCATCRKPACGECLQNIEGAFYCSEACYRKGLASGARAGEVLVIARKTNRKLRNRVLISLAILLLIGGCCWFFYSRNQRTVDRKFRKISRTIKHEAKEAVKSGKKAMPGDSRYKREREALVNQQ